MFNSLRVFLLENAADVMYGGAQYARALRVIVRAIELRPDVCRLWVSRSFYELALQRYGEALRSAEAALACHPDHHGALFCKAEALAAVGDTDNAREIYCKIAESPGRLQKCARERLNCLP